MRQATRSERTASILGAQLADLARALAAADVPGDAAARLLEAASIATMRAVALDARPIERARRRRGGGDHES